jgi:polyhydroxyalkanoate synthesis regulator phasin
MPMPSRTPLREATEQADYATKSDLAELRAEIAALETRLVRWMVALAGIVVAAQRFL